MKKILISIILFFPIIVFCQNNWYKANVINQNISSSDYSFINADIGYAMLYKSPLTIYKTTNKGVTWTEKNNDLSSIWSFNYPSIKFINENTGFIITTTAVDYERVEYYFYKSTNGGTNWSYLNGPVHDYHWGFQGNGLTKTTPIFTDNNTAYINTYFAILKTNNSFQSFDTILRWDPYPTNQFFILDFDIDKDNSDIMYAGGGKDLSKDGKPDLKTTTNGGTNWDYYGSQNTYFGAIFYLNIFNNNGNRFIRYLGNSNTSNYGHPNVITEFNNGNFSVIRDIQTQYPDLYQTYCMDFLDNNTGYITCRDLSSGFYIINTTDGGFTWNNNTPFTLNSGEVFDDKVPFSKCGDIRYMRGKTSNSEFVLISKLNANLYAKSDNTQTNTTTAEIYWDDYSGNQTWGPTPLNMNVLGGKQNVSIISSGENDLFYKWNSGGIYEFNPLNPSVNNYYVDKNGENITANFKTKQKSNTQNALSNPLASSNSPQVRSLKDYNGNISQVHESMGGIFFSRSTNGGTNWSKEEVVNGGSEYYTGFPTSNTTDYNSYPSMCELTTLFYNDPYTSTNSGINVAAAWQRINDGSMDLNVAFRELSGSNYFWRKYGTSESPFSANNGIIRSFDLQSSDFVSKPAIFASYLDIGSGPITSPYQYLILVPHLEPASSGKKLCVTTKLLNQPIVNNVPNSTTTGGNTFVIDESGVSDYSVVAQPFYDINIGMGYNVYFVYLKNNNIYYRADKFYIDDNFSIARSFFEGNSSTYGPIDISSGDGVDLERVSPDISLRNGKPIIAYRGKKHIITPVDFGGEESEYYLDIYDYPIVVKYKYSYQGNDIWSTPTYYNSSGNVQNNPDVEGHKSYGAYLINFSSNITRYKQFVYTDCLGNCSPYKFEGKDAKIVNQSLTGTINQTTPSATSTLITLSTNGSLYDIGKQQFTMTSNNNGTPEYDILSNLIGILREQNINYNFELGPVVAKNTNVTFGTENETSVTNQIEFSNTMVSAPFSLGPNDTLILGGNGYYKFVQGATFSQKRFSVFLIRKSSQEPVFTLFNDSIGVVDTIQSQYLRGFVFGEYMIPEVDSFYVQLVLDSTSLNPGDEDYQICNVYSPGEIYGGEGDNNRTHKRFVHFEKGNNRNNVNNIPKTYSLSQNYPNPFNPVTNIKYQIPNNSFVTIKIYDITGREIAKLVNEYKQAGCYTVSFNGSNFASGVYFYRIQVVDPTGRTGDFTQVKKMILIK